MKSMPDMYTQHQFRMFISFQNNDFRRFLVHSSKQNQQIKLAQLETD